MISNNKFLMFFLIFFIMSMSNVIAFSTNLPDGPQYRPTETIQLNIITTTNPEKGNPYLVEWFDENGTLIINSTGTLSTLISGVVFEVYDTLANTNWENAYVQTTVNAVTLTNYFNVTGNSSNSLIITNIRVSPKAKLGALFSIEFGVEDVLGNIINGAECEIYGTSSTQEPLQRCTNIKTSESINGKALCDGILNPIAFKENNQYLVKINCQCGTNNYCFNQEGNNILNYYGGNILVFNITPWLSVNTITDQSSYKIDDTIYICANITNQGVSRLPINVVYSYRCQNGGGNLSTDRILLGSKIEERGISANTTQNQCNSFLIVDDITLETGATNCYASTSVSVLDANKNVIYTYDTTSPLFEINVTEINPYVRWMQIDSNNYYGIVNITKFNVEIKDVDVRINERLTSERSPGTALKSYSVTYLNGTNIPYDIEIQIVDSSRSENQYNSYNIDYFEEFTITILDVNTTLNEEFKINLEFSGVQVQTEDSHMLAIILYGIIYILMYWFLGFWNLRLSEGRHYTVQYWFGVVAFALGFIHMINMSGLIYSDYAGFDITGILYLSFYSNLLLGSAIAGYTFWKSTLLLAIPDGYVDVDSPKWKKENTKW